MSNVKQFPNTSKQQERQSGPQITTSPKKNSSTSNDQSDVVVISDSEDVVPQPNDISVDQLVSTLNNAANLHAVHEEPSSTGNKRKISMRSGNNNKTFKKQRSIRFGDSNETSRNQSLDSDIDEDEIDTTTHNANQELIVVSSDEDFDSFLSLLNESIKRSNRGQTVSFGTVTEVSFRREQSYCSVPTKGGVPLGMASKHCGIEHFTIEDYENKKLHRMGKEQQNISSHTNRHICDKTSLQPISGKDRLAILREAGVVDIDDDAKEDCNSIRTSRSMCGCDCRDYCDPDVCSCILAGISCQIERENFPCGCKVDNCQNPNGCNTYNENNVRGHFVKTIRKLQ
ncbi:cysteine/serine-rich nuclear protein 3-like isoform X1 [Aethina tumida]|uniref:cysteine/serine-rich nuclear protein 3-like isoform X1 n=1 Tax=Aethina tumida TaxID=116153 RepID=UPI002147289C|nr:cysteine/serine-rich nuclear protein 3-like isoform X1 [Aethina tumida]